ncbi:hypothetical protein EXIGUO8H_11113 [Exiguobacterium sp. 8H]|nr:hypothetical protein EXIGUO8H_11113 [Exiguobacterium sp. 8H]
MKKGEKIRVYELTNSENVIIFEV